MIISRYTKRQPRFSLAGISQTSYSIVIATFCFFSITAHTCNRVGQARVLFYMVYIAQFSNALFRTPKVFSIAICAFDLNSNTFHAP